MIYTKKKDEVNGTWYVHGYADGTVIPENAERLSEKQLEKLRNRTHVFDESGKIVPYVPQYNHIHVAKEASYRIKKLAKEYTKTEQETWPEQVLEATQYLADPDNAVTPLISARASARKITVKQMAEKVLQKRDAYKQEVGKIFAAQDKLLAMPSIPQDYNADRYWT